MAVEKTGATLTLTHESGWTLRLAPGEEAVLGRAADTKRPIPHIATDKHHAKVKNAGGKCTVEDLKSTSGTYLNGKIVREVQPISDGDVLRVGPFEIKVARRV